MFEEELLLHDIILTCNLYTICSIYYENTPGYNTNHINLIESMHTQKSIQFSIRNDKKDD